MSTALQGSLSAHNAKKIKACAHYKIVMSYINQESARLMCLVDIHNYLICYLFRFVIEWWARFISRRAYFGRPLINSLSL